MVHVTACLPSDWTFSLSRCNSKRRKRREERGNRNHGGRAAETRSAVWGKLHLLSLDRALIGYTTRARCVFAWSGTSAWAGLGAQ